MSSAADDGPGVALEVPVSDAGAVMAELAADAEEDAERGVAA